MPNDNEAENLAEAAKPAEAEPVPAAAAGPHPHELLGRPAVVIAKDPNYARHEAAHAATIDEKGWVVFDVNLDLRRTRAETKAYTDILEEVDWDDPAEIENHKPRVIDFVTTIVAGYVGERMNGSTMPLVSELLRNDEGRLLTPPPGRESDTDRTVYYLQRIECNTPEDVEAAEERANEILTRRKAHFDALVTLLLDKQVAAGQDLEIAMGKEPPKEEAAG